MLDQGRTLVPGHRAAVPGDVVAVQCAGGNAGDVHSPEPCGECEIFDPDPFEDGTIPADHVHLVDDHDRMANAEQRDDMAVAACLWKHPPAGLDHQHCDVGRRCSGYQITGVLLVAG